MNRVSRAVVSLVLVVAWALAVAGGAAAATVEVSVGDSYSSGEGARNYDAGTEARLYGGNGCHRSALAWPRLFGVVSATHLACSGAKTADFYEPQKSKGPDRVAQLPRLERLVATREVSRVWVTIGGNDLGFSGIVKRCLVPRGLPSCLKQIDSQELPLLRDVVLPRVTKVLIDVQRAAGSAQVVLVGYPDAIPRERAEIESLACHLWLAEVEQQRIYRIETALDIAQATAASRAGVPYVSVRDALEGHGICAKRPWVNPLGSRFDIFEVGHPNEQGQAAIARIVEDSGI